jgi:PAS domain S-box-containing protein
VFAPEVVLFALHQDDSAESQPLLGALDAEGLTTAVTTTANAALAWLAAEVPRAVLLDVRLERSSDFAVLRAIRADRRLDHVPVIVLAALDTNDDDADVARAFELGATDLARRPLRSRELILRVRGLRPSGEPETLDRFTDFFHPTDRSAASLLTKTKVFLERVIDASVDAIISADMNGRVLLFNRAAQRCYGYDAKDVVGRMNVRSLYPRGQAGQIMRLIHAKEHGGPGRLERYRTDVLASDGSRVPVLLSAALILDHGRPVGSVGIFNDLRERLRIEAELTAAQDELQTREKQALIAELAGTAAHELNQPLTSVLGYAELIRRRVGEDSPLVRASDAIVQEAERMAEIVRKIGMITRYETKTYVGTAKIIDLDRAIESEDDPGEQVVR